MLEITRLPNKGRAYVATTDIPQDTLLCISEPLATTVSQEWTPETCMWCFHFSYPKKQKVKAVTEDQCKQWNISMRYFKDFFFCSDRCKQLCINSFDHHWDTLLGIYYRIELEFLHENNSLTIKKGSVSSIDESIDIKDDHALSTWLSYAWDCTTKDVDLYKELDEVDKPMLRLIATCLVKQLQGSTQFESLFDIQDNELTYFRQLYQNHQLPIVQDNKETYLSILPQPLIDVMALYCTFIRACRYKNNHIPTLPHVHHTIFRSIYFRERANSFGLWENGEQEEITDDLELLGYGIYPSAVYFNHSCDPNVLKKRDGRTFKFISKRYIRKGEEACISYGQVDDSVENRRSRLWEHYHFICQCSRCLKEQ